MGWLSSIFGKKKEIEIAYVRLNKLSDWFDEKTEPLLEIIKDDVQVKFKEINDTSELARHSMVKLQDAQLKNPDIPNKAVSIMKGNREAYLKSVDLFLNQLRTPTAFNLGSIKDYITRFEDSLNQFTKISSRSYYVLQEFFKNESAEVANHIKRINLISRSLLDNKYSKVNKLSAKIEEIKEFLKIKKRAEQMIQEEEANHSSIKAIYRETEDRIEKIKQSRDFKDLELLEKDKKENSRQLRENEAKAISLFSPLDKSIKKYSKIAVEGQEILKNYLESPVKAILKDEHMMIIDVLARLKQAIETDQLDLRDKKKDRALEAIDNITRNKLKAIAERQYELVEVMDKLKRREGINTAAQKLNELNYKLAHLKNQIDRSELQIGKMKRQTERPELDNTLSEIETGIQDLLSVRLKILKNENEKETD